MEIKIVYFTSTGNTLWLAQQAKEILEAEGYALSLLDVVLTPPDKLDSWDMLGIFYPVWGSGLPVPLKNFVFKLPQTKGKKIFLIGNCALFTGDTGMYWKKIIEKKGYDVFYLNHLIMPTNCSLPGFNFLKIPNEEKKKKILSKAKQKLKQICFDIVRGRRRKDGIGPLSWAGGHLQRHFLPSWEQAYKKQFTIDKEYCIGCRVCERVCPQGNIKVEAKGKVYFGDDCIFCLKCYNLCPVNAVLIGRASKDSKKYNRYKGPAESIKPIFYR